MAATATINAKIDPEEKARFVATAESLGLSPSAALKVFIRNFIDSGGFQFEVRNPRITVETMEALREVEGMKNGSLPMQRYESVAAMRAAFDAEDDGE